jgi:DNA-binding CsgD family transcriptional regulator
MLQTDAFERYDDLVGLAYRGIGEDKPWQAFVECLAEVAGVRDASVTITTLQAPTNALVVTSDHSPHLTSSYMSQVFATDVMQAVNDVQIPKPTSITELMPAMRWTHTDLYEQYLKPFHIHRTLLIDVWRDPLMLVRLGVDRTSEQADFGIDERRLIERLAKHLANSMSLRAQMQSARISSRFYERTMDQLGVAALFLNAAGELVDINQTGSLLLSHRRGLHLRGGKLIAGEGRNNERLRALLRSLQTADSSVSQHAPQGLRLLDDNGQPLLEIVGRRLPHDGAIEAQMPVMVLLVTSCREEIKQPCGNLLRDIYGFTACEAHLAKLLIQGYSTQEAASQLGVSINTIKTHLKGIFEKTGYNKQSQVVAILNNSALKLM